MSDMFNKLETYEDWMKKYYGQEYGEPLVRGLFGKATDHYDMSETQFVDPDYAMEVQIWILRHSDFLSLLPKTTYAQKGDSYKAITAEPTTDTYLAPTEAGQLYGSYDTMTLTDIDDTDGIDPAIMFAKWQNTLQYNLKQNYTKRVKFGEALQKQQHAEGLANRLDYYLTLDIDTTKGNYIDSIDRVCSDSTECTDTTYISATTDADIYGYTRTNGAYDAQVSLPSTAADRVFEWSLLDTVTADAVGYSSTPHNYMAYTSHKTLNEIQRIEDPKERFVHGDLNAQYTINGVKTRKGGDVGFSVASITSSGITAPIFGAPSGHYADPSGSGTGNLYFLDMDHLEYREALPTTFLKSSMNDMLSIDYPLVRYAFVNAAELICTKFKSQAAVKWLKAST